MSFVETKTIPIDLLWRLRVDQYHAMIQSGILTDNDPVELLEGWLIVKMPKIQPIESQLTLFALKGESILPSGWYVDSQEPITLSDSEPEPDVMIVQGDTRQYLDRHPGAENIALVVEVADTTLMRDRNLKKRTYARAKVPIYWIVNLVEGKIEVYTQPFEDIDQPNYAQKQDYRRSEVVPLVIEGIEIGKVAVDSLILK